MAKKKSPIREMINESLKDLRNEAFPADPTLDESDEITGPERFVVGQKRKDEVVIDSLLADINGKDGYFVKIKKEMRPNEWMLMKTIESEWRQWADVETSIANIVKEHTKTCPQKWGTGQYRMEVACRSGMRGKGYSPVEFWINAEEEFANGVNGTQPVILPQIDPNVAVASKIEELSGLVGMLKTFMPAQPDPAKTQEQIAGAFEKGLAIKANEGNANAQMMTAMMTGMMSMMATMASNSNRPVEKSNDDALPKMLETLKSFGVLGQTQEKPKGLVDTLGELKLLGIDLFKKDDPLEQVGKLKQIASIASDFMGMSGTNDRPSILEKIVDALAPALPTIMNDIKETAANAVRVQEIAGQNIRQAQVGNMPRQRIEAQPQQPTETQSQAQPVINEQVKMFFNQLYESIKTNNRMFYPVVYTSLLQEAQGQTLLQGIAADTHNAKHVIELLQQYGGERYRESEFVMKFMVPYVNGFIIWIKDMMKPKLYGQAEPATQPQMQQTTQESGFDAECQLCHAVYGYSNEQDFMDDTNKVCGANVNGVVCPGILQSLVKV